MPDDSRGRNGGPPVKVVDRRRFRPDAPGGPEPAGERDAGTELAQTAEPSGPELEAKLAAQATRIDELTRAYAALVEDNKAFRARLERERDRAVEVERAAVAQALLDAADELERALASVSEGRAPSDAMLATLTEGVRLTLAGLSKRIGELGAARLEVVGQRFDPRIAEAVDVVPVSDTGEDGVVLEEVRAGYRIGDRIIRPSRVRVGRMARA